MSKAKRLLRSVRFKYVNSIRRIATCSNCILLVIVICVAMVVVSLQRDFIEDFVTQNLDEFESAKYARTNPATTETATPSAPEHKRKISSTVTVEPQNAIRTTVARKSPGPWMMPPFDPKRFMPAIKVFYRGKQPRMTLKTTKSPPPKKMKYRDIFEAMAHPRSFPTTTEEFQFHDAPPRPGLNDWIQANNPMEKDKLLVYSAYWDDRFPENNNVRIMAVMVTKNPPTVYCRLQMADGGHNDVTVVKKIMNEHWRLRYASYFLSCELSKNLPPPVKVLVSPNRNFTFAAMLPVFRNRENIASPSGDIAVCVKPLHYYYNRATWLVEFIELHRILGAEHFFFYNHSVGHHVDALLRHYMDQKVVTVLPWNLPVRSQKEIRTEGIFASLNDCVFRTMYKFHYVVLLDFDEYIVPREHDNYLDMLERLEEDNKRIRGKPGSFVFRNTFFYLYWENDTTAYGAEPEKPPEWFPYFVTQYKTRRLATSMKTGSRSKYIVVPDRVLEVGNHVVWRHVSGSRAIQVPESVALLHHYRICEFGGFSCLKKPSLVDRTANKYGLELLTRVQKQCSKIYPALEGKCPVSPPLGSPW